MWRVGFESCKVKPGRPWTFVGVIEVEDDATLVDGPDADVSAGNVGDMEVGFGGAGG